MKILTIIGARPQFIKAAALSREFSKHPQVNEIIVHTGQHFDDNMSEIFFREMEIPRPDYNLAINGLSHGAMTGQMLEGIEQVILKEQPDLVLVYGDTNSTLAGALAAKKLHIKVAHVEAGLRSYNMDMPEEINRILTDRISDWLFCPTETAVANLRGEGVPEQSIHLTGDVMEDAAQYYAQKALTLSGVMERLQLTPDSFVLATIHRAENTDHPEQLSALVQALNRINKELKVVVPLHPRTLSRINTLRLQPEFMITEPLGYFDMISLLHHCALVITDSGGLQKEAFFFRKHCITTRTETEWTELIVNGYNTLADASSVQKLVKEKLHAPFPEILNLYGNGKASEKICSVLLMN